MRRVWNSGCKLIIIASHGFDNLIFAGGEVSVDNRKSEIAVRYHSGYRGDETPRSLLADGREYAVEEVVSRQRGLDAASGRVFDIFRIRVAGRTVLVKRTEAEGSAILPSSDLSFLEPRG
jgi:hypothetical protein